MKKLLIFLMVAIPLIIILVVNLAVTVVSGFVSVSVDSITLNQTQVQAKIEDNLSLEAFILPKNATNKEIIWESTNEEVAIVDLNGNVSFVGFGKGYITATTVDGNKRASCYFYVTDTNVHQVMLSSDYVENGRYFVSHENTLQLKSSVYPLEAINKKVRYVSEDESIATVDMNGLVYGLKIGRTKITAISEENENVTDSIIVEVVKPVQYLQTSNEKAVTSTNNYQISYSVYPEDATVSSVTYKVSDSEIATVNSVGLVTFKKVGTVEVELISNQGQHRATIEVTYTNGFATDLIIGTNSINASINEGGIYIPYSTIPSSVDVDVEFSSDNEDVAYVDDSGYVQFIGGGRTLIRAKILASENEYIEKVISVYIESPATAVNIDDRITTAQRQLKLEPKSYPLNSTNDKFFFHSTNLSIATVNEEGIVTFVNEDVCEVVITIYANEDNSEVRKDVTVVFTNGYPLEMKLQEDNIKVEYGEISQIRPVLFPLDAKDIEIEFNIISQNGNGGNNVIQVLSDGTIISVGGGTAIVEVSCNTNGGNKISKQCYITVERKVEDIDIIIDLDYYNGEYITCAQEVNFEFMSLTQDATNKNIFWELKNNNAVKSGENSITFNNLGVAEIYVYSQDKNYEEFFYIRYLKNNILSASLSSIPKKIEVGESFDVSVLSTLPRNAVITPYIKCNSESTLNSLGKVLEINGLNVKGVAGGSATITIIASNLQFTYNIEVIQKVTSISVTPADITTTNTRIVLQSEVLPEDATNKKVVYSVKDESVATIEGNVLSFKKNGIAEIIAEASDNSGVKCEFTIEKIEKGAGNVAITGETISMLVGDTNKINLTSIDFDFITYEIKIKKETPIISGAVVELNNDVIKALNIGEAEIECIFTDKYGTEKIINFKVVVCQLSEDIEFNTNLDYISEEYCTAVEVVNLNFKLLPEYVTNKDYSVRVLKFTASEGDNIPPYIDGNNLVFRVAGTAIVRVDSQDGMTSKQFRIKYTGGEAVDIKLNIQETKTISVGEEIKIEVVQWIPFNTQNKQIFIRELFHTQGVEKVIDIEDNILTGVAGGVSKICIETSSLIKEIEIIVFNPVQEIVIDDEIVSISDTISINAEVYPADATIKTLNYFMEENEIATINGNEVVFTRPGSVFVNICTMDGTNLIKRVKITSTFGYLTDIDLNTEYKSLVKGSKFNLFVKNYYPNNANYKDVYYEIISSIANDQSQTEVISITTEGVVNGVYGGEAIIRVYALNYYGEKIYKDCHVKVITYVDSFEINFSKELSYYQGSYVVAQNTLGFENNVTPCDASDKIIICESEDEEIAEIEGNSIIFKKIGKVLITFTARGSLNNSLAKTYSFYYTGNNLISAKLDESLFDTTNSIVLDANESLTLTIKDLIPCDITDVNISLKNIEENRIDSQKQVITLTDDKINALHGGTSNFDIYANDIYLGRYTITVMRRCNEIYLDRTEAFTSMNQFSILAKALPSDTYETYLKYEIIDGEDLATVNENGLVEFKDKVYGVIEVKVSCLTNENVYKILRLEYSNKVKRIYFKESPSQMYINGMIDLSVIDEQINVDPYEVVFESSNPEIATVSSAGRVIANDKAGEVIITAYVKNNPDVYVTKTITVMEILTDIELQLDNIDDNVGLGGYKVWGNRFLAFEDDTTTVNRYKMEIKSKKPENCSVKLLWKSSDTSIAEVSETGVVTFVGTGKVTISVEPIIQYNQDYPLRDSYVFNVVDGLNIYKAEQWSDNYNIVLQQDIKMTKSIELKNNLYGNGFMIDFTAATEYDKLYVTKDNILIDNVILRGKSLAENPSLSSFTSADGTVVRIGLESVGANSGDEFLIKNVLIKNTIIENCYQGARVISSQVQFAGCIIRNTTAAGVLIGRLEGIACPSEVGFKECILSKSLFSTVVFKPENNVGKTLKPHKIIVDGELKIYNWIKLSEFNVDLIKAFLAGSSFESLVSSLLSSAIDDVKNKLMNSPYCYTYEGEKYIMLGIASLSVVVPGLDIKGNGTVVFNDYTPYVYAKVNGGLSEGASYGLSYYTLLNDTKYITPGDTYTLEDYLSIRQPF